MPDCYLQTPSIAGHAFGPASAAASMQRTKPSASVDRGERSLARHPGSRALASAAAPSLYYDRSQTPLDYYCFNEDYVRRLAEGDASAEAHFTAYFGNLLTIKLRSRLRFAQAIDDIRQETFLRVLEALRKKGGLQHPERLGAFVNSVCNNVLQESFRSQARYAPLPEEEAERADHSLDLEGALVTEERKRLVENVLGQLPETDRKILKMLFYDEVDKQEICRMMGVNRDYLRVLVYRARVHFRVALEKIEAVVP